MNHKTFRKLFFNSIYSVIILFIKQAEDVILSKNTQDTQASENQGKDKPEHIHKNQQQDDVISSKNNQASENQGKDALKDSTKYQ